MLDQNTGLPKQAATAQDKADLSRAYFEQGSDTAKAKVDIVKPRITYASKSEAVAAEFLHRYVDNWHPVVGQTYLIPLGRGKTADFKVDSLIIEYHPIVLDWDMKDSNARHRMTRILRQIPEWAREQLTTALKDELALRYYLDRKLHMETFAAPHIRSCQMIVAESAEQFYSFVLKKVASKELPSKQRFLEQWAKLLRSI